MRRVESGCEEGDLRKQGGSTRRAKKQCIDRRFSRTHSCSISRRQRRPKREWIIDGDDTGVKGDSRAICSGGNDLTGATRHASYHTLFGIRYPQGSADSGLVTSVSLSGTVLLPVQTYSLVWGEVWGRLGLQTRADEQCQFRNPHKRGFEILRDRMMGREGADAAIYTS